MQSFLDPAILFFILGLSAGLLKSNLEIPPAISRFLSLYLLMALGLKGGFAIAHSGITSEIILHLACAILLACLIPLLSYQLLKKWVSPFNAVAIAATYGSVSAVTFITATQFLETQGISFNSYMAAAMALMESPAIIIAILLANVLRQEQKATPNQKPIPLSKILHESLTDGTQLVLLGSMLIGLLSGDKGQIAMQSFSIDLFKGMLAFFLLDMGLTAARNIPKRSEVSAFLIAYALLAPLIHASLALLLAHTVNMSSGDTALLMTLAASASYIAVPAVIRHAIPEASPSIYLGLSLGITFPFNILIGIPLYAYVAQTFN